jgi:hypothetical protein
MNLVDMLEIELHEFFFFFIKLSWFHDTSRGFNRLTHIDLDWFFFSVFFKLIFFQFHHLILSC